jgi:CheY-like chemotaxis protein
MNDKPILLIEDNPDDRDLTIRALKKNNVLNPVTVASNGAEAPSQVLSQVPAAVVSGALARLTSVPPSAGSCQLPTSAWSA